MRARSTRLAGIALAAGLGIASLAACGSSGDTASGGSGDTRRRREEDRPAAARVEDHALRDLRQAALRGGGQGSLRRLQRHLQQRRPGRRKQQQQAESALTQGANVLVLDPVDGKAAASVVASAKSQDVPVIAYDRFIEGADYYVSFDNETVGKLQAQTLVDI